MEAEIGFYRGERQAKDGDRWQKFRVTVDGSAVTIVDAADETVSDEWVAALPTALTPTGPVAITDDPETWLSQMSRAKYTFFGVRLIESS